MELDKLKNKALSQISSNEGDSDADGSAEAGKTFITDKDGIEKPITRSSKKRSRNRKKRGKKQSSIGKGSSGSNSKSRSKHGSLNRSNPKTLSPKSIKTKYVICKDCKRRRMRNKKVEKKLEKVPTQDYLDEKQQKLEQRIEKINSTKIFKSQNSMLSKNGAEQRTEEDYESDFKIEASLESADSSS